MEKEENKERDEDLMHNSNEGKLFSKNFIKSVKDMEVNSKNDSTINHLVNIYDSSMQSRIENSHLEKSKDKSVRSIL